MKYANEPEYTHGQAARTGILLVNLGTPEAPTARALRPYLREFLSDPRVVEIPRPIWWLILNGIILNTRPKKSAEKYASIWTAEGSPLKVHTEKQAKLLKGWLGEKIASPFVVEYAMRYGTPAIPATLEKMKAAGCDRILILPAYPQYAASSTATAFDAAFDWLKHVRNQPALRTVKHYHDHPAYIRALAANIRDAWQMHGRPDVLLMSFHGVPRYTLDKGDPYHCECRKTGRLLAEALGLEPAQYRLTFQSRFGRAEWIQPYTDKTLEELGRAGVGRVDVVAPGFTADCLETLEELAMEGRATFLAAGGKAFHYIPALNEHPRWIDALGEIALANLGGWVDESRDRDADEAARRASRSRALALGARS
ncbi:ferrochelatase [Thiobacillus sedimenti]|uniref:Ferrochelatase n=1 Tax=Thiobacillus sedimenti TaxID=3110231 RepID=A0ABZ1CH50_9PROT|nr:ferrochelatase [Thiobacillus sp. SCUT-2]WRS38557.1 ferrochelatase [Thiobacillus sp. SCUT-2]